MTRQAPPDAYACLTVSYGQMEVRRLLDGRTILVLPGGARKSGTWYELTPEQAVWLAAELVK